ncbi:Uncharacterised protein [Mycobacteroides abscessus]|nr:Uncharacterised protein [Mycobacteroides abscessus]
MRVGVHRTFCVANAASATASAVNVHPRPGSEDRQHSAATNPAPIPLSNAPCVILDRISRGHAVRNFVGGPKIGTGGRGTGGPAGAPRNGAPGIGYGYGDGTVEPVVMNSPPRYRTAAT